MLIQPIPKELYYKLKKKIFLHLCLLCLHSQSLFAKLRPWPNFPTKHVCTVYQCSNWSLAYIRERVPWDPRLRTCISKAASFQTLVSINDQGPSAFENLMNENFEPMASSNRDTEANVGLLYILFAAMVVVAVFSFLWVGGHILIFLLFKNRLKTWW